MADTYPIPNPTDCAWAAGILEGEGCIRIAINHIKSSGEMKHRALLVVVVSMKDERVVRRLESLFGSHIRYNEPAMMWVWTTSAKRAMRFLCAVRPFMCGDKADQADVAMDFQRQRKNFGRGGRPLGAIEQDHAFARRLSEMKRSKRSVVYLARLNKEREMALARRASVLLSRGVTAEQLRDARKSKILSGIKKYHAQRVAKAGATCNA